MEVDSDKLMKKTAYLSRIYYLGVAMLRFFEVGHKSRLVYFGLFLILRRF